MLYYLFDYLEKAFNVSGASLFQFSTFRAAMAIILSLIISLAFGKRWIRFLQGMQIKESVRKLGLEGEEKKQGTPTMGGVIILSAILIPTILLTKLHNIYIVLILITTIWMGLVGFLDDYIKVFRNKKAGLAGRFKVIGQVGLGLIVGTTLFFNQDVFLRSDITDNPTQTYTQEVKRFTVDSPAGERLLVDYRAPITNFPFSKDTVIDYRQILAPLGENAPNWSFLIYIPVAIFIITAVSNGCNLTDGMDGLATGIVGIIGVTLGVFAFLSGNSIAANYLNILYIPNVGELFIFCSALVGACIGFLWYNANPAQVFMGDTGSLALGGIIATLALILRKELLLPLLCGIFLVESLSVILQVSYFKYTKRKYGAGRRIFKMAPLHHHYQKLGMGEPKIVTRFWIVGIMLAVLTFVTLKIR